MTSHRALSSRINQAGQEVSAFARAIVARRMLLTNLLTALVALGVIPAAVAGTLGTGLSVAVGIAGTVAGVAWVHKDTTPADPDLAPTSSNGKPLVELQDTSTATLTDLARVNAALAKADSLTEDDHAVEPEAPAI